MKLKPLHNNVIIKPAKVEETTKFGIVLPDSSGKEKPERGEVIAVGTGKVSDNGTTQPMSVKIGDQVVFKNYMPSEVKVDGEDFLVLAETDILAIVE